MAITPLPTLDRTSAAFRTNVDTFFGSQLPAFAVEANALEANVNAKEVTASAAAATATTKAGEASASAGTATTKAGEAVTSASNADAARVLAQAAAASITAQVSVATNTATSKATPVDADEIPLTDSAASFGLKKLTWANLKVTLKAYLDSLYAAKGANSDITSLAGLTTALSVGQGGTGANTSATARAALGAAASGTLDASGIIGTATNDNAVAGKIGEFQSVTVAYASRVSLTSNLGGNITSLSLSAGDWDVSGVGVFDLVTGPSQFILTSISTTSATSGLDAQTTQVSGNMSAGYQSSIPTPVVRLSLASTTTVYLVVKSVFLGGTMQSWGFLRARRVR